VTSGNVINPRNTKKVHYYINYANNVCFLLGNSPASKFYVQTFRNTVRPIFIGRYLRAYEDGTVCSETSAYKILTPGNYPEESIQHSEHGESLKSEYAYNLLYSIYMFRRYYFAIFRKLTPVIILDKTEYMENVQNFSS
jgi:hypothetical protein